MYFTLDDIDELVISGRNRLDNLNEYDISYYEKYVNENIKIILELLRNFDKQIDLIKDTNTKKRVLNISKYLVQVYEMNKKKEPTKEYDESQYALPANYGVGYIEKHKYAKFIEKDLANLAFKSGSNLINFMNRTYEYYKFAEMKGQNDSSTLYNLFSSAKLACSKFGIHCPDAITIYESFTKDPYDTEDKFLETQVRIDEENSLKGNIVFNSLPYTITLPMFTYQGPDRYEAAVKDYTPTIVCNKSYLLKLENLSDEPVQPGFDLPKIR